MRISITTNDTALTFMRRAGYGYQKEGSGEVAFVRRVGGGMFPRYHAYTQQDGARIIINLHIDQKQPTYGSGSAHSGEYSGPLVEQELQCLRALAVPAAPPPEPPKPPEKKGFFGKLFG